MNPLLPPPLPGTLPHFLLWMGDSGLATVVTGALASTFALPKATRRSAWLWAVAFVGVASLVFATKLGLFGWGDGIPALDFRGPSGHATLSAFVWPMSAWLLTMHAGRPSRRAAVCLGAASAAGTAWVLVTHGFHSAAEVGVGSLLGGGVAGVCMRLTRLAVPPARPVTVLAGLLVATLVGVQHGKELPALVRLKWRVHEMVALQGRTDPAASHW